MKHGRDISGAGAASPSCTQPAICTDALCGMHTGARYWVTLYILYWEWQRSNFWLTTALNCRPVELVKNGCSAHFSPVFYRPVREHPCASGGARSFLRHRTLTCLHCAAPRPQQVQRKEKNTKPFRSYRVTACVTNVTLYARLRVRVRTFIAS